MEDRHSIWQFQDDGKDSYPKAVRVQPIREGQLLTEHFVLHPRSGT